LAAKDAVLRDVPPAGRRVAVEADLAGDWRPALLAAGFEPSTPTVWLADGVLCYLASGAVRRVLAWTAALCKERAVFGADLFGTGVLSRPGTADWLAAREAAGQPPPYCTDEPATLFAEHGWSRCTITEPGQAKANYGRLPEVPDDWTGGADPTLRTYLVLAERSPAPVIH
jgi:methyltransferase (TIGR00027 family)